jgi:DNA-binding transcriptional ArsR family regulator/rhodanese-related sulfurtransferase
MLKDRAFTDGLYRQLARIGKTLSNPHRLELLELLAQGERTVESLASEVGLSLANASQHLQALRRAALVEPRKQGLYAYYRLADPAVFELCTSIRRVAERQLADLQRLVREQFGDRATAEPVSIDELLTRMRAKRVVVLDTRPAGEYAAGHIAGALSVPVDELQQQLKRLPKGRDYVAYCRGPYCVYADRAVEMLHARGRRARRLAVGFPEWRAAGLPVGTGAPARVARRSGAQR